jgi:hypothetical protein
MPESGVVVHWIGGNCPVQAEGSFDGVPFYFRARGTSVTLDVEDGWGWRGPEYEWPDAGWIAEDLARAYISAAYDAWLGRHMEPDRNRRARRRNHTRADVAVRYIVIATELSRALGDVAQPAVDYLMAQADVNADRTPKAGTASGQQKAAE